MGKLIRVGFAALLVLVVMSFLSCSSIQPYQGGDSVKIDGIPGPEDLVLDTLSGTPRLLVSSADRREGGREGQIFTVELSGYAAKALPRNGGPAGPSFNPHGISIVKDNDGTSLLYVVNHRSDGKGKKEHSIVVYEMFQDRLAFIKELTSPLLVSPNDLCALPDGSMYISNDGSGKGGMMEIILSRKKSTVVWYDGSGNWRVSADKLAMANGIQVSGATLFLAVTRENAVYAYGIGPNGSLETREKLASVKGADNITLEGDFLYIAGHVKDLALASHMTNPARKAPSTVFRIRKNDGETVIVFQDDGNLISAASVAVPYEGTLFIGQIADDYIVAVNL